RSFCFVGAIGLTRTGSRRRRSRRKGGHACGKTVEPGDETRVIGTPFSAKAEVAVAEHASERDQSDIRDGSGSAKCRRRSFELGQRPPHLAGLMAEPLRLVFFSSPPASFIDREDR